MRTCDEQSRLRALRAYELACQDYNSQPLNIFERMIHSRTVSQSVRDFGEGLRTRDVLQTCGNRIANYHSMWSSNRHKSFNSHFLRHLKAVDAHMYREVIARGRRIVFASGQDVVLYRADTRSPSVILREGFKPQRGMGGYGHRDDYARPVTGSMGVSTTTNQRFANDWGGTVYKIHFKAGAITDPRVLAADVLSTAKRYGDHYERRDACEVNFITRIPPRFIESYWGYYGSGVNTDYTGKFAAPAPAPATVVEHNESVVRDVRRDPLVADGAASVDARAVSTTIDAYKAGDSIRLIKYSCDIQLYRGAKGQVHCVFSDEDAAGRFIKGEALVSDRHPDVLKKPDPRRYQGLFAVRVGAEAYARMRTSVAVLPGEESLPAAPAFTPT